MPIWTVDRKRPESSMRFRAVPAPGAALLGHGLEAGAAGGNDGEFGKGEDAVEGDESESDDQFEQRCLGAADRIRPRFSPSVK